MGVYSLIAGSVVIPSHIILSYRQLMCFFKSIEFGKPPAIEPCQHNCHQLSNSFIPTNPCFPPAFFPCPPNSNAFSTWNFYPHSPFTYLQDICVRIQLNNQNLSLFDEKLTQNKKILQVADNQILQILTNDEEISSADPQHSPTLGKDKKTFETNSILLTKLFPRKSYKYKLRLCSEFPRVIYKERRLHLSVRLMTNCGKIVRNANLIHLCLAACDADGKWIVGEDDGFFMQGRSEVDLYKGEAEFEKVYPSDISRHKPGGRVALIIYPKPSLLHPTGPIQGGQTMINYEEIEPVCLENIMVKAKKRQKY